MQIQTKNIVAYGLFDYTKQLQEAFDEGFRVDLEDNLRAPNSFGAIMEVTLVKEVVEEKEEKQPTQEVVPEVVSKRGRKAST